MVQEVKLPSISFIAARSYNGHVIGCDNKLPWTLRSDLQRFRKITINHSIIMGRKTFQSIGKKLPNRTNIILSRETFSGNNSDNLLSSPDHILWAQDRDSAVFFADITSIANNKDDFFIIGGEQIYKQFFERDLINRVYLTEVFADVKGDAYLNMNFSKEKWNTIDEQDFTKNDHDEFGSRFIVYQRKDRRNRYKILSSFFTDQSPKNTWLKDYIKKNKDAIEKYEKQHLTEVDETKKFI